MVHCSREVSGDSKASAVEVLMPWSSMYKEVKDRNESETNSCWLTDTKLLARRRLASLGMAGKDMTSVPAGVDSQVYMARSMSSSKNGRMR